MAKVCLQMGENNKSQYKGRLFKPVATVRRHYGAQNREKRLLWGWSKLLVLVLLWARSRRSLQRPPRSG
jgi:hypothetical protein